MSDGAGSIRALATVTLDARALDELGWRRSTGLRIWSKRGWPSDGPRARKCC
jgi:hypothetical protein